MKINTHFYSKPVTEKSIWGSLFITLCLLTLLLFKHNWNIENTQFQTNNTSSAPDFGGFSTIKEKKQAFFAFLRPFVQAENKKIAFELAFLDKLELDLKNSPHHRGATLRKIKRLATRYEVEITDIPATVAALKLRVGQLPESLVLAQAANESAWGTSRFAKKANNYFGQWCYKKGCGIVPNRRDDDASHKIRYFDSARASVASYMNNINSHYAYEDLRQIRADLTAQGQKVSGRKLAQGLLNYSERGESYIAEIRALIRQNKLE